MVQQDTQFSKNIFCRWGKQTDDIRAFQLCATSVVRHIFDFITTTYDNLVRRFSIHYSLGIYVHHILLYDSA